MEEKKFDQTAYVADYLKEKYEQYNIHTPKGEIQDFKKACRIAGEKPATVIRRLLAEYTAKYIEKN